MQPDSIDTPAVQFPIRGPGWAGRICQVLLVVSLLGSDWAGAQQAPRGVPVEDDERVPVPRAVPFQPGGAPPKATVVADPAMESKPGGTSAPRPSGPDEDLFDYATMVYERKEYAIAAQSLAQYLQTYPSGRHVPVALFRLGECYVNQGQMDLAERYYVEVVRRYPKSEGAPSAAYRLGAMRFNARNFEESARYFAQCEQTTPLPQVKLAAIYNKSRAYQMLGDKKRQMEALQLVVEVKEDNPYRETALLALGSSLLAEDKKDKALPLFQDLIETSPDKKVVSEAMIKAGVIQAETGRSDDALKLFEKALSLPETTPENRGVALVGSLQAYTAKKDYNGVIDLYNRNAAVLPPGDLRPKMLMLVGNAYRLRKTYARAVEVYLMIEQNHSEAPEAFEAGYWKLYCFYLLGDNDLGDFVRAFLARYGRDHADHEFIVLARLILADFHFNRQEYPEAADAYAEVKIDKLPDKLQPGTLFNKGWADAEAGRQQEAIAAFSEFLGAYPKHPYIPKALARRGLAYKEARDLGKAQADFDLVIKDFPQSDAAELCYLHSGFIALEQREVPKMIKSFESLLEKFPSSKAAAQAAYHVGRGYLEQKSWDKAVQAFERAIRADRKAYLDKASQLIVQCYYFKEDADHLAGAIDAYREANEDASIPPNVLTWLGLKFFDRGEFGKSARFLAMASTPDAPENTDSRLWNYLGMAYLEIKSYQNCLEAIDFFLKLTPDSAAKAKGYQTRGAALLGLGRFEDAVAATQEGLRIVKEGRVQAQLLILEGRILFAEGDRLLQDGKQKEARDKWRAAAGKFVVPSQIFDDPEITPQALDLAVRALDRSGDPDKADELRAQLKKKYPNYKPKE